MKIFEVGSLILRVALRNLWLYRFKTVVIGFLLGAGAFLAVLGLTLTGDVEKSMRESVTGSVAGHLQVSAANAKDELALFGGGMMGRDNVGTLADFAPISAAIAENANVEAVVPMGIDVAILARGNEMDETFDSLRAALKSGDQALVRDRVDKVRFQLARLGKETEARRKITSDVKEIETIKGDLAKAEEPAFLDTLQADDEIKLQFLETRIAPLSGEKQLLYLQYLGTDTELHRAHFSKFRVVEGEPIPAGKRGILVSRKVRETQLKKLVARLFDNLTKRTQEQGIRIKGDPENEREAADLPRQYAAIVSDLDGKEAQELSEKLAAAGFKADEGVDLVAGITTQLKQFLTVNDANVVERAKWFYENIAPKLSLYEINPGETVTLKSYTRSGYIKALPLKVYGVYTFAGLEDSDLAGAMNIIDLVSFRELYGQMNASSRKELEDMRAQAGIRDVAAADAENALFGSDTSELETRSVGASESASSASGAQAAGIAAPALSVKPALSDAFDPTEQRSGLAISLAVVLKDASKIEETRAALQKSLKERGLEVTIVDWQKASGIVGQFTNIVRLVLLFALVVIFVVALVIINNSIIVSTFNRIREIGTMRAIGAQRSFVRDLFLAETGITGLIGALLGTAAALALLVYLGARGIPAPNDVVKFLFSGARLYPSLHWPLIVGAPVVVTLIATLTSVYAARHAAHVKPAEAMQEKE